jgi:hypothetical protein
MRHYVNLIVNGLNRKLIPQLSEHATILASQGRAAGGCRPTPDIKSTSVREKRLWRALYRPQMGVYSRQSKGQ